MLSTYLLTSRNIHQQYPHAKSCRIRSAVDRTASLGKQLLVVCVVCTFVLYPGWAQAGTSVFACRDVDLPGADPLAHLQTAVWEWGYWS
jgi:hypothetical protein